VEGLNETRHNFDYWIEREEQMSFPRAISRIAGAVLRAIHFYDNRYRDKPGVPYSLWFEKFKEYIAPYKLEQALALIRETLMKGETREIADLESALRERLLRKQGGGRDEKRSSE
jgi:hypothetical protein